MGEREQRVDVEMLLGEVTEVVEPLRAGRGEARVRRDELTTCRSRSISEERTAELVGLQAPVVHGAVDRAVVCSTEELVHVAELDTSVNKYLAELLTAAPEAIATAKELLRKVYGRPVQDAIGITTDTIAARRVSAEGQEGMKAFLEKRKPSWTRS